MSPVAAPLDDDDLFSEILVLLPPQPSSLPRASAVSKRWRRLVSDPAFSRRFRRHHRRNPPLLGFFHGEFDELRFEPTLESPNRVPPSRFSLQLDDDDDDCYILPLGCRHGFVLLLERIRKQVLVWSPFTGDHHCIATPPGFDPTVAMINGAVLGSATGDVQHFKVVLAVVDHNDELENSQILVCVYSSETGVWGNLISTPISYGFQVCMQPAKLVGHSLNWLLIGDSLKVLEFDLERQMIAVIQIRMSGYVSSFTVMRAEGGGLAFLNVSGFTAQLWKRKIDSDGVASWVMGTTIELDKLLSLDTDEHPTIHGFAEENNLVFLSTQFRLFTVQVEPLQFKELPKPEILHHYHPFESVYAAGI